MASALAIAAWHWFRVVYSSVIMVFCIVFVSASIFQGDTTMWESVPRGVSFALLWVLLAWLSALEGGQVSIVGLKSVAPESYAGTHPRAARTCELCHRAPSNLERFVLGRQFLVLFIVFFIAKITTVDDPLRNPDDPPLGLQKGFINFGQTGFAATHFVAIIGQLVSQMIAARYFLDFINMRVMHALVALPSLFMEWTGVVHTSYVLKGLFSYVMPPTAHPAAEAEAGWGARAAHVGRCVVSCIVWGFAAACVFAALGKGWTNMPGDMHGALNIVIFVVLWFVLCFMEGLQIASTAMVRTDRARLAETNPRAARNAELVVAGDNLQSFFIGRQLIVAAMMFVLANMSTADDDIRPQHTVLGLPDIIQEIFLETGILGAIFIVVGQLTARIVATSFPGAYMGIPVLTWAGIWIAFIIDAIGIVHVAWLLTDIVAKLGGFQPDPTSMSASDAAAGEEGKRGEGKESESKENELSRLVKAGGDGGIDNV